MANNYRSLQKCLCNFWMALYQFLEQEHFSRLFWTLWRLKIPKCTNQETLKHECCRPFGEIILCCDNNPSMQYWHWEELQNRVARKNAKESPLFLSITTCCWFFQHSSKHIPRGYLSRRDQHITQLHVKMFSRETHCLDGDHMTCNWRIVGWSTTAFS